MGNSPARPILDVGSVIADTYTIEGLLGRGGMGAVFVASHNRLPGKKVAIKLLHAELTEDEVVARFRREAMIASQLNHPNIVGVTDFNVTADGTPYLVLEYLQGESLAQRLARGAMPLDETLAIMRQIGSAIAAAHREGIVHRDLKPQNIFLVQSEVAGHMVEIAKVLDFGISKIRGSQTVKTQESTLLGTPQYMAPEQATGQHTLVDGRTDVFALGAIVYEMLSGVPAFDGASIPEVVFKVVYESPVPLKTRVLDLPDAIAAAIETAMAKRPEDRFPDVGALIEALTGFPLLSRPSSIGVPVPETGFAAGSRHRNTAGKAGPDTSNDAFAQTMGSLDPVASPVNAQVRTVASVENRVEPRRRPIGLIVALVLGLATIAAVAVYLATRTPAEPRAGATGSASGLSADAALAYAPTAIVDAAATAATPTAIVDAAVVAHAPVDARPRASAPDARVPQKAAVPDADTDSGPEDDTVRGQLQQADAALASGQHDLAERLANTVINAQSSGAKQRAHAHAIHGAIECAQRNNREGAQIDLRNIRNRPKFRRMLIDACAKVGIDLR